MALYYYMVDCSEKGYNLKKRVQDDFRATERTVNTNRAREKNWLIVFNLQIIFFK